MPTLMKNTAHWKLELKSMPIKLKIRILLVLELCLKLSDGGYHRLIARIEDMYSMVTPNLTAHLKKFS